MHEMAVAVRAGVAAGQGGPSSEVPINQLLQKVQEIEDW